MKTLLVLAPTEKAIDMQDVKSHLNLSSDFTTDDVYLDILIASAVSQVENITNRKLTTQTWKAYSDEWPDSGFFILPFGKLHA